MLSGFVLEVSLLESLRNSWWPGIITEFEKAIWLKLPAVYQMCYITCLKDQVYITVICGVGTLFLIFFISIGGEQAICAVDPGLTFHLRHLCKKLALVCASFEACANYILSEMDHCAPTNLEEACSSYFLITQYIELNHDWYCNQKVNM